VTNWTGFPYPENTKERIMSYTEIIIDEILFFARIDKAIPYDLEVKALAYGLDAEAVYESYNPLLDD